MVERKRRKTWKNDPQTWTTVWELTVLVGVEMDGEGQRGKIGTTVIE